MDSLRNLFPSYSFKSLLLACSCCALLLLSLAPAPSEARSVALPAPQCHPAVVQTMKPRIRQICKALEAIWEFSDVMENYLDEKENSDYVSQQAMQLSNEMRPLPNTGVKRKGEDIDHVFLRFGKRGGGF